MGLLLLGACTAAVLAGGCGLFDDEPEPLELGTPKKLREEAQERSGDDSQQAPAPGGPPAKELPESLDTENLVFYAAEDAPTFPEITIKKRDGSTETIQPARDGKVVMVVCWSLMQASGQAAAAHANQLGRKYYGQGLRILGLVGLKNNSREGGQQAAARFMRKYRIGYPVHILTTDALSTIVETADMAGGMPNFVIIDREGRLRFYQRGFSFTLGGEARSGQQVYENALYGRKIEDFVRKLLKEGQPDSQLPQRMRRGGGQGRQPPQGQQNQGQSPQDSQNQGGSSR